MSATAGTTTAHNTSSNSTSAPAMPPTERLHHLQELRLRIWLPDDQVGKVIGKKGAVIKHISTETSTQLLTLPQIATVSTTAAVASGADARSVEEAEAAEAEISTLLRQVGVGAVEDLWTPAVLSGAPANVLKAFMSIRSLVGDEVDEVVAEFYVHRAHHQLLQWGPRRGGSANPTPWVQRKLSADHGVRVHVPDGSQPPYVTLEGPYASVFAALDTAMGIVHEKLQLFTPAELQAAEAASAGAGGRTGSEWTRNTNTDQNRHPHQHQQPAAILTKTSGTTTAAAAGGNKPLTATAAGNGGGAGAGAVNKAAAAAVAAAANKPAAVTSAGDQRGNAANASTDKGSAPATAPAAPQRAEIKSGAKMAVSPVLFSHTSHRTVPAAHEYFLEPAGSATASSGGRRGGAGFSYRSAEVVVDLPTSIIGLLLVRRTAPVVAANAAGLPPMPPANVISQIQTATHTLILKVLPPKNPPTPASAGTNAVEPVAATTAAAPVAAAAEPEVSGSSRARDAKRSAKRAAKEAAAAGRGAADVDKFGSRGNKYGGLDEDGDSDLDSDDSDDDSSASYCTGESGDESDDVASGDESDDGTCGSEGYEDAVEGDLATTSSANAAAPAGDNGKATTTNAQARPISSELAAVLDAAGLGSVSVCTVGADGKVEGEVIKFRVRGRLLEDVEKAVQLLRDIVSGVSIRDVLAKISDTVMRHNAAAAAGRGGGAAVGGSGSGSAARYKDLGKGSKKRGPKGEKERKPRSSAKDKEIGGKGTAAAGAGAGAAAPAAAASKPAGSGGSSAGSGRKSRGGKKHGGDKGGRGEGGSGRTPRGAAVDA